MDIMKAQGYNVMLREENNAIAWFMVANSIGLISTDKPHSLNFYSYVKGGTATLKDANAWNKEKKYSKMYLDKDKDVVLELDLDLTGGVTEARIIDFIVTCRVSYNVWYKEFGPE
jgi:hypothetical protein